MLLKIIGSGAKIDQSKPHLVNGKKTYRTRLREEGPSRKGGQKKISIQGESFRSPGFKVQKFWDILQEKEMGVQRKSDGAAQKERNPVSRKGGAKRQRTLKKSDEFSHLKRLPKVRRKRQAWKKKNQREAGLKELRGKKLPDLIKRRGLTEKGAWGKERETLKEGGKRGWRGPWWDLGYNFLY